MTIPEKIANLITEHIDEVKPLDTPSQVFSQALLQRADGEDSRGLPLEAAIEKIKTYGAMAGLDILMVRDAIEYAKLKWGHYGAADVGAEGTHRQTEPEFGPDLVDPDSLSDRGF